MCGLFGLSCNKPVSVGFSWRGFLARGRFNRDCWGVAFYSDGRSICLIKEPNPSVSSAMASFLKSTNFVRGKVVISHVRWASKGRLPTVIPIHLLGSYLVGSGVSRIMGHLLGICRTQGFTSLLARQTPKKPA